MRFLRSKEGLSLIEYIIGGVVILALLGLGVYSIANAANGQSTVATSSINAMPAPPTW